MCKAFNVTQQFFVCTVQFLTIFGQTHTYTLLKYPLFKQLYNSLYLNRNHYPSGYGNQIANQYCYNRFSLMMMLPRTPLLKSDGNRMTRALIKAIPCMSSCCTSVCIVAPVSSNRSRSEHLFAVSTGGAALKINTYVWSQRCAVKVK